MKKITNTLVALALTFVAGITFSLAFAVPAYANNELEVVNQNGVSLHVSDAVTTVKVAKLDADTQEYISGATLQIINKETGEVVDSWVSTDSAHDSRKVLDVDTHYILREISAPDAYSVASDTEFYIEAVEGGTVHIVSGDDADLFEKTTLKLYDKKGSTTREISVYKTSENTTTKVKAPQTGDETPFLAVTILVVGCLVAIRIIHAVKKHMPTNE